MNGGGERGFRNHRLRGGEKRGGAGGEEGLLISEKLECLCMKGGRKEAAAREGLRARRVADSEALMPRGPREGVRSTRLRNRKRLSTSICNYWPGDLPDPGISCISCIGRQVLYPLSLLCRFPNWLAHLHQGSFSTPSKQCCVSTLGWGRISWRTRVTRHLVI